MCWPPHLSFANQNQDNEDSQFIRLSDYLNTGEKIKEYFQSKNRYVMKQSSFYSVPGTPFVYWASENAIQAFQKGTPLSVISAPRDWNADREQCIVCTLLA